MRHEVDFLTATDAELAEIRMPVHFTFDNPGTLHGLVFWFDVSFNGTKVQVCQM